NNGQAAFVVTVGAANPGQFVAATATDPNNNTSAFSLCIPVAGPTVPGLTIRDVAGLGIATLGLRQDTFPVVSRSASSNANDSPRLALDVTVTDQAFRTFSSPARPWSFYRPGETGSFDTWNEIFTNPVEAN